MVARGEEWGKWITREFGMDMYMLYIKWITNRDLLYTAQGTLLSVMWQPGWEGSLGENGCMYMCGWVPLLSTWNYHNIVNWMYANKNLKKYRAKKEKKNLVSCSKKGTNFQICTCILLYATFFFIYNHKNYFTRFSWI